MFAWQIFIWANILLRCPKFCSPETTSVHVIRGTQPSENPSESERISDLSTARTRGKNNDDDNNNKYLCLIKRRTQWWQYWRRRCNYLAIYEKHGSGATKLYRPLTEYVNIIIIVSEHTAAAVLRERVFGWL